MDRQVAIDRRRRKRYFTLKNAGKALAVVVILFAAITIRSEMRRPSHGEYGRLFGRELKKVETPSAPRAEVVQEAEPVADSASADPMLVAPAAREQYLSADAFSSSTGGAIVPAPAEFGERPLPQSQSGGITIVGDSSGVGIATATVERPRPLSGGIFKKEN